jgi:hypothetical protein
MLIAILIWPRAVRLHERMMPVENLIRQRAVHLQERMMPVENLIR